MNNLFQNTRLDDPTCVIDTLRQLFVQHKSGTVMVMSPDVAAAILAGLKFKKQRKLYEGQVLKHLRRLKEGRWYQSHPITIAVLPDGRMLVVDGQHRLTAISRHGYPTPLTIIFAEVGDENDAGTLYTGFDECDSRRTAGETMSAAGVADKLGVSLAFSKKLYNAMPILNNDLEIVAGGWTNPDVYERLITVDARLDAMSTWRDEAIKYLAVVNKTSGKVRTKLQCAGFLAVGLYTFRYQPDLAHAFWHGLADNDGLRASDPRAALLRDMSERSANSGSMRQVVQVPVIAWNAFCEKRELKIVKCVTGAAVAPWGTPLGKGGVK